MKTLPEDILPIVCDYYASTNQLRSLATIGLLNHRIHNYARTRSFKYFEFRDDRSSRVLEHLNKICEVYDNGELIDQDILMTVDSKDIDPLELDPELRWLRGMRACEAMVIKDLLYGRDIESLINLGISLSKRELVLFPKVKRIVIGGKLVKKILATESNHTRPKITPLDLLIAIYHSTRPRILCIQDSGIFTPPQNGSAQIITQQQEVRGGTGPSRGGHMSTTINQLMRSMDSLEEIHYYNLNLNSRIHIEPKKGIHHIIQFSPDTTNSGVGYKEGLVREIQYIVARSVVGKLEIIELGAGGGGGGGGGGGRYGMFGPIGQGSTGGIGGVGLFGTGAGSGTGTGVGGEGGGGGGMFGAGVGGGLFGAGIGRGVPGGGGGGGGLFGHLQGGLNQNGPTFAPNTHANFPLFGTTPQVSFGTAPPSQPLGTTPLFGTLPQPQPQPQPGLPTSSNTHANLPLFGTTPQVPFGSQPQTQPTVPTFLFGTQPQPQPPTTSNTHANFLLPLFGTGPQISSGTQRPPVLTPLFGSGPLSQPQPQLPTTSSSSSSSSTVPSISAAGISNTSTDSNSSTVDTGSATTTTTTDPSNDTTSTNPASTPGQSNTVPTPSTSHTGNAIAGPSTSTHARRRTRSNSWDHRSVRSDGDTDMSDYEDDEELPSYAPPFQLFGHGHGHGHGLDDNQQQSNDTNLLAGKQSSWHFILPTRLEMEEVREKVMNWVDRIKGDVGDQVRAGISFGVMGEEGGYYR